MDCKLLQSMSKAVFSANFFWTRIGLKEEEGSEKLAALKVQLLDVITTFMCREKEEYLLALRQIKTLQERIQLVMADLETLLGSEQLALLFRPLEESPKSARANGCEKAVDSYLRVQKVALKARLQTLLKARHERLQEFVVLKAECRSTLKRLGLATVGDATCAATLAQRVANHEEVARLEQCTQAYQAQLQERIAYCAQLASDVLHIARLLPVSIEESYLLKLASPTIDAELIYSEERQEKLEKVHAEVQQEARKTWSELKEASSQLAKLYRLFEVADEDRHPCYKAFEAALLKFSELQESGQTENDELLQSSKSSSRLLLQSLGPFFAGDEPTMTLKGALEEVRSEVAHYRQQKAERIAELIGACRRTFFHLLTDCCLVPVEALQADGRFHFLFTSGEEAFTEHLLNVHEAEIERLRQYLAKHEHILSLLAKWRKLKEEGAQVDSQLASGTAHLRSNRGGILEKMLRKQRANKKQMATTTQQIGAWLSKQKAGAKGAAQQSEIDRLLPFHLYTLRPEDIEREVGPVVQKRVQQSCTSSAIRRPPKFNSVTKKAHPTPLTLASKASSSVFGSTPLNTQTKLPVSKVKLFQSVSTAKQQCSKLPKLARYTKY